MYTRAHNIIGRGRPTMLRLSLRRQVHLANNISLRTVRQGSHARPHNRIRVTSPSVASIVVCLPLSHIPTARACVMWSSNRLVYGGRPLIMGDTRLNTGEQGEVVDELLFNYRPAYNKVLLKVGGTCTYAFRPRCHQPALSGHVIARHCCNSAHVVTNSPRIFSCEYCLSQNGERRGLVVHACFGNECCDLRQK